MIRKTLAFILVAILAVALAAPSSAAVKPSKVGLVSFNAATTTTLTLNWPTAKNATSYEVFRSVHQNMSGAVRVNTTKSRAFTSRGLTPGKIYCFQVRGKRGKDVGKRSSHTCKPTVRNTGTASGSTYRVMTYNVCTDPAKCDNRSWARRQGPALSLIASQNPDVIATQEAGALTTPNGYTLAVAKSAKRLFYRTDRFTMERGDFVEMGPGKYAVWAELVDKTSDQHVIFVDVHTTSGKGYDAARTRKAEITKLRTAMAEVNLGGVPVVYAGDFNSNRNRPNDYLAGVFHSASAAYDGIAYYDAYDLARSLSRPNYNSYNGFRPTPIRSYTWGDHVDHVWVDPKTTRVLRWATVASFSNGKYAPIPSDHNALRIDVQVN